MDRIGPGHPILSASVKRSRVFCMKEGLRDRKSYQLSSAHPKDKFSLRYDIIFVLSLRTTDFTSLRQIWTTFAVQLRLLILYQNASDLRSQILRSATTALWIGPFKYRSPVIGNFRRLLRCHFSTDLCNRGTVGKVSSLAKRRHLHFENCNNWHR